MAKLMLNGTQIGVGVEDYKGATRTADGTHGLVPAATSASMNYFLRGDGTWASAGGATITDIGASLEGTDLCNIAVSNVYTYGDWVTGTVEVFAYGGDLYSGAALFTGLPAPYGGMIVYCTVHCANDSTKKFNAHIDGDGYMVAEEAMDGYGMLNVSFTYLKAQVIIYAKNYN